MCLRCSSSNFPKKEKREREKEINKEILCEFSIILNGVARLVIVGCSYLVERVFGTHIMNLCREGKRSSIKIGIKELRVLCLESGQHKQIKLQNNILN